DDLVDFVDLYDLDHVDDFIGVGDLGDLVHGIHCVLVALVVGWFGEHCSHQVAQSKRNSTNLDDAWSNPKMMVVINLTALSTMIVELTTSFLVGHATLRSSPFTSPRYSLGPSFPRLGAADGGRRFPPSDAGDLGLSVPVFALMRL